MQLLLNDPNRRAIRTEPNPLDKSTVVSICPLEVRADKVTLQPASYVIPPGSYEKPSILVVTSASWWNTTNLDIPPIEITTSSVVLANSIVVDWMNGLLGCNMSERMPGLFFVPGPFNAEEIKREHKPKLDAAFTKQRNWYAELVKIADVLWARTNGNPLSISDTARLAARELGMNNKEWLKDFQTVEMVRCPACGSLKNPNFPVCQICKAVTDPAKAKALGLQFVQ